MLGAGCQKLVQVLGARCRVPGATGLTVFCVVSVLAAQRHSYLPAEVESGARLYEANCTGCHGPEGDGIAAVNFSKGQFRRAMSDDDLVRVIIRGIPGTPMPPSTFSEGQAGTIGAYLRAMGGEGTKDTKGTASSGDPNRGKAVFEGKGQCLTCHAVSGNGSRTGPNLTEIGGFRRRAELERSLLEPDAEIRAENRAIRAVTRDGVTITGRLLNQDTFALQIIDSNERLLSLEKANLREYAVLRNSAMPSYRDRLTSQELTDIVSYLVSLKGRR
jgi:putative heme-binding domain-containing protein